MTNSQFSLLMSELTELRRDMSGRFDKIDDRLTPLEDQYQQKLGADQRVRSIAGVHRATLAIIISIAVAGATILQSVVRQ